MRATNEACCKHKAGFRHPSPKSFTPALTWSFPSTLLLTDLPSYLHFRSSAWISTCNSSLALIHTSQVHLASPPFPSSPDPPCISCSQKQCSKPDTFSQLVMLSAEVLIELDWWLWGLQKVFLYCPLHMEVEGWRLTETNSSPRNNVSGSGCALWH